MAHAGGTAQIRADALHSYFYTCHRPTGPAAALHMDLTRCSSSRTGSWEGRRAAANGMAARVSAAARDTAAAQQPERQPGTAPLHEEPAASSVTALKEWAVTCAALGAGQQTVSFFLFFGSLNTNVLKTKV